MSTLTLALSTALVDFLWQGAVVGLALWMVLTSLRGRSANARYAVSCAALAILAALPILTVIALAWSVMPAAPAPTDMTAASAPESMPQTLLQIWLVPETPRIAWLAVVQQWALPVWSVGVLIFSARLAWGWTSSFALRRHASTADASALSMVHVLAQRIGLDRPIRVLVSSVIDGPSVVGWLRPAILLPPATAMGLTPQQLEAVLAHELAHITRHDYLVNLFQVVIETLFFYHPVVWWISKQIRIEREMCCDDVAVRSCGDPVSYARALTALARNQLAAPALPMGATGGSLLHRVQRLLGVQPQEYGPSRVPGLLAVALAIGCVVLNLDWLQAFSEQPSADLPRFEVASVKQDKSDDRQISMSTRPDRFTAHGVSLFALLRAAYQVQEFQIAGGPDWLDSDRFDIAAKAPDGTLLQQQPPSGPGLQRLMLRALLADRFNLVVHKETRQMPVYALVLARSDRRLGPQLRPSTLDCTPKGGTGPCGTRVAPGTITAAGRTLAELADVLSTLTNTGSSLNRLVVDRTGLSGIYDAELRFTPEHMPTFGPDGPPPGTPSIDLNGPSIFTAVQEQLGLKLESQRGPVEVLVIDRVEHPTED